MSFTALQYALDAARLVERYRLVEAIAENVRWRAVREDTRAEHDGAVDRLLHVAGAAAREDARVRGREERRGEGERWGGAACAS